MIKVARASELDTRLWQVLAFLFEPKKKLAFKIREIGRRSDRTVDAVAADAHRGADLASLPSEGAASAESGAYHRAKSCEG